MSLISPDPPSDDAEILDRFLDHVTDSGLELYPAQEEAILALFDGQNVILNTPTGSGKSLVAMALQFHCLANGRRSIYTCPIKALVNEKWMDLCSELGAENVGLCTGDATINRDAPVLCCTAEILANMALREGAAAPVDAVIMDEFHFYSDRDRGMAWQVPLLTLPQAQFLLMSATLGDTGFFEDELRRFTGRPAATIRSDTRPVPLDYEYIEDTPLAQTIENLVDAGQAPIYAVHFARLAAADTAQGLTCISLCTREEKSRISKAIEGVRFNSPGGAEIKRWLRMGIGIHHAGLLPKYRVLVEKLAREGLLRVICGTDTLGVGINVPIRTVLLSRLSKYDGEKTAVLGARDFHQISGRAGRKGFDDRGRVVVQAPEHEIENNVLARKGKKFVKRKPPEKGYAAWDRKTFERLCGAAPERLASSFAITHSMLLNVLRQSEGVKVIRGIIARCHESESSKKELRRRGWQLFRSLLEKKIIEIFPRTDTVGVILRINADLQEDFSLDHALSLYVHEAIALLDPQMPEYPLVVLTLVESIIENPYVILRKQLARAKDEAIALMKADGLDYEQRMEELEKIEYPKPNREFVYASFNAFADRHPWVGTENIQPKSIAREMFEDYLSFEDYTKRYHLERSEGILLRYLSQIYKALRQTVPDFAKNDILLECEAFLSGMIRQVDSSLLDEWERLKDPTRPIAETVAQAPEAPSDITQDRRQFLAAIRTQIFNFLRVLASGDFEAAAACFPGSNAEMLSGPMDAYLSAHERLRLDPEARNLRHTRVTESEDKRIWVIEQTLVDPEGVNDWVAVFHVDLPQSRRQIAPAIRFLQIRPIVEELYSQ